MTVRSTWWKDSERFLHQHPELLTAARAVRGFSGGAKWMHCAMSAVGWRMPPIGSSGKYEAMGWVKYGLCSILAVLTSAVTWVWVGPWYVPVGMVVAFYAVEAQMVFLFPEALLGRRTPWFSARGLTISAGGTLRVMGTVLPIAAGMLGAGWWRGKSREKWVQGCMAVILWHRHLATGRKTFTEDMRDLPKLEIGPASPLLLRRESVKLAGPGKFRVLWISDLHWRGQSDADTLMALLEVVRREKPDVCLLGGDFLESSRAIPLFKTLLRFISRDSICVALPGNHDRGQMLETIATMVRNVGGCWFPDVKQFEVRDGHGEVLKIISHPSLMSAGSGKHLIAVHDPAELDGQPPSGEAVMMAGHLHGGQCVLSSKDGRLLPAAWFYRHAWTRRERAGHQCIVSRGAGDTLPIRWNCPREVIICELS